MGILDRLLRRRPALAVDSSPTSPAAQVYQSAGRFGPLSNFTNPILGFGTGQDPLEFTEWQPPRILQRIELEAAFVGCGEARNLCAALPRDATSVPWTVTDPTDAAKPLEDLQRKISLRREIRRAATFANLYGECFLFPVLRVDGGPIPDTDLCRPLDVSRVTGIDRIEIILGGVGREATPDQSSRWRTMSGPYQLGQPTQYMITMARAGVTFTGNIHTSRLIKFSGDFQSPRALLALGQYQQGEAVSVLQAVIVELFNWRETGAATRRAAQQITQQVLTTPYTPAPDAPSEYMTAIWARWAALKEGSHLRTTILGMNADGSAAETLERMNFPVEGLPPLNDAVLTHLASATGRPKEILGGLQPTGIINSGAAWQDGWYKEGDNWREGDLRAALDALIPILYMADQGSIPTDWTLTFEPLGRMSPKDQAEIEKLEAETLAIYADMGAAVIAQIRRSKFGPDSSPPAGVQPATIEEMQQPATPSPLPLAVRSDPVARAQAQQDAADGVLVALAIDPTSIAALQQRVAARVPGFRREPWPHLTLYYAGAVPARALPEVERVAFEMRDRWPVEIEGVEVGPLGDNGAIVLFVRRGGLDGRQREMAARMAKVNRADQFPRYVPHVTLGYGDLAGVDLGDMAAVVRAEALVVRAGEREVVRWPIG